MSRFVILISVLISIFFLKADKINDKKIERVVKKGKKVAEIFCDKNKLKNIEKSSSIEEIKLQIESSKACEKLSSKNLKALSYFLKMGLKNENSKKLYKEVKKSHKCPVCGMFVYKYPKWSAKIVVAKKSYFFDGVKDMMKFYFFDGDFPYSRAEISEIQVSDFYTLDSIDAKSAFYVIGSKVYGPMGNELIPFKNRASAEIFLKEHQGKRVLKFSDITPKIVMALDGIELK